MRGAVVIVCLAGCAASPSRSSTISETHDWPMFRGDSSHRGSFADRQQPAWRVRWQVEIGERIDASPVIDATGAVWIATRAGTIARLDGRSGTVQARRRLAGGVWASPALVGRVLIVANDRGLVVALDRRTLATRWQVRAPSTSFSSLTAWANRVYFCSGRVLLGLNAENGELEMEVDVGAACFTSPALSSDGAVLVVGTRGGEVVAVATTRGQVLWRAQTTAGAHNDGSPAIAGEHVFIGSNDRALHSFDLKTGRRRWTVRETDWVVSTPAVADGLVIYGDDGGTLRAVSASDGTARWSTRLGGDVASSPTLVGSLVVHGAHDGKLWAHHAGTGRPYAPPIDLGAASYASVALAADGAIVIATHKGRVIAVE